MAQATQTLDNKLQIFELREELNLLRSFVIGVIGKDKEGEYNSEFVKKVFQNLREKPQHIFKDKNSFLATGE